MARPLEKHLARHTPHKHHPDHCGGNCYRHIEPRQHHEPLSGCNGRKGWLLPTLDLLHQLRNPRSEHEIVEPADHQQHTDQHEFNQQRVPISVDQNPSSLNLSKPIPRPSRAIAPETTGKASNTHATPRNLIAALRRNNIPVAGGSIPRATGTITRARNTAPPI
jgi:hypothetical protein